MPCSITGNGLDKVQDGSIGTGDLANLAVTPEKMSQKLTLMTAKNATGTAVDFDSIPAWAKRITVMFNGVSTNGTSHYLIQLGGSGGIENTGYLGTGSAVVSTVASALYTSGFGFNNASAAGTTGGQIVFSLIGSNIWAASGVFGLSNTATTLLLSGSKTLSATLDRVRITTVNGTDTFDAGSINIMYEG
jgi:hypothetical protein